MQQGILLYGEVSEGFHCGTGFPNRAVPSRSTVPPDQVRLAQPRGKQPSIFIVLAENIVDRYRLHFASLVGVYSCLCLLSPERIHTRLRIFEAEQHLFRNPGTLRRREFQHLIYDGFHRVVHTSPPPHCELSQELQSATGSARNPRQVKANYETRGCCIPTPAAPPPPRYSPGPLP